MPMSSAWPRLLPLTNEDEYGFITYVVPKVAFDTELDLIPALERLGMKTPFSDKADFSNLTATPASSRW